MTEKKWDPEIEGALDQGLMPAIDLGPEDSDVAAAVKFLCVPNTEVLVVDGLPLFRGEDGEVMLNGKPVAEATIAEKRAVVDAARARQKAIAKDLKPADLTDPAKNPFIKLDPGEG